MRRARLRTAVNLAAAQNRRRQTDKPESQNSANGPPSAENGQIDTCKNDLKSKDNELYESSGVSRVDNAVGMQSSNQHEASSTGELHDVKNDDTNLKNENKIAAVSKLSHLPSESATCTKLTTNSVSVEQQHGDDQNKTLKESIECSNVSQLTPDNLSKKSKTVTTVIVENTPVTPEFKETPKINEEIDDAKLEETSLNTVEVSSPKTNTPGPTSQSAGLRIGRSRFRPNLSIESTQRNRLRRISGSLGGPSEIVNSPLGLGNVARSHRVRTISNSSTTSETDNISQCVSAIPTTTVDGQIDSNIPNTSQRTTIPSSADNNSCWPDAENRNLSSDLNQTSLRKSMPSSTSTQLPEHFTAIRRQRRMTETKDLPVQHLGPTVFDVRKADHKKKFAKDVPERKKITMFDLIYYNPSTGDRMTPTGSSGASTPSKGGSSMRSSRANSNADAANILQERRPSTQLREVCRRLEEEAVDDPKKEEEEDNQPPVPQVKIGPDGALIIDEASTVIDTTAAKKAKEDLMKTSLVFESSNMATNYGSWGKKRKNVDWTERETVRFFKALSVFGTDFSMMENVFRRRSRHDLKMKFKKEERSNRSLVDRCLSQGLKFDASFFDHESEQEEDEERLAEIEKENKIKRKEEEKRKRDEQKKARRAAALASKKKRPKGQSRKKRSTRGYYSSDGVSGDEEHSPNSNSQSPTNDTSEISRSQDVDSIHSSIDKVLNDAMNSFASRPSLPTSQKHARSSSRSVNDEHIENVQKFKRPRVNEGILSPGSSKITPEKGAIPAKRQKGNDLEIDEGGQGPSSTNNRGNTVHSEAPSLLKKLLVQNKEGATASIDQGIQSKDGTPASTPTFSFPPALLAANPSLANAAPGSIVVVASPRNAPHSSGQGASSVNQQLLHVFMVSDEEKSSTNKANVKNKDSVRGEPLKSSNNLLKSERTLKDSKSIFPHRQRKMSESCLDTTSVGRVRTHSGCNPSISPFHSPFSPPMSPYGTQSPHFTNISQDQEVSNKPQEEDTSSSQNRIVSREMSSNSCTGSSDNQS